MFRRAAVAAIALVPTLFLVVPGAMAASPARPTVPVAPGVELASTPAPGPADTGRLSTLSVDLSGDAAVDYVHSGRVTDPVPLSKMPAPAGTVAAVNGDFFDSGASGAPMGAAVQDGHILTSPTPGHHHVASFDASGRGAIHRAEFSGSAALPDGDLDIDRLNSHQIPAHGTGVFTPDWGSHPRERAAGSGPVTELVVSQGTVRKVRESAGSAAIERGTRVLLGRGAAAQRMARLRPGASATLDYTLSAGGSRPHIAIGGRHVLLRDGEVTAPDDGARHPRSVVGFSSDGRRMFVLAADGRAPGTRGASLREAAEHLRRAGAHDALELDGGGSATMLAREPGTTGLVARNRTGDDEREVPNGLAVHVPRGDGEPRGVWVRPELRAQPERGAAVPARPDPYRVFSGLSRALSARVYDSAHGPAPVSSLSWSAKGGTVEDGVFRAGDPGRATVAARSGGAQGGADLDVLPGPQRLRTEPQALSFSGRSGARPFVITGSAPDGTRAAVEPADAEITVEPDVAEVTPRDDHSVLVEPTAESGTATITVAAGGRRAELPVRIGSRSIELSDFDDADAWSAETYRAASAEVAPAAGRTGRGLALSYDFTGERRSRAAYAAAPAPLETGATAFGFSAWVRGDGNGALLALTAADSDGRRRSFYGPRVDWHGWRKAHISVPAGSAHPVAIERVYLVETRSDHQYRGRVVVDDLRADIALRR